MTHVATLISPDLTQSHVQAAAKALRHPAEIAWLAPGRAADLMFEAGAEGLTAIEDRILEALPGSAVDVVVQPVAGRAKKLLVADMDSTMIGQECIDELADELGLKPLIAAITERAMRGEIAFEPALRERVGLLKGLPANIAEKVLAERIVLTPGGRELVMTMRAHGGYCALVSGGFTMFTNPIATRIGFDENRANVLIVEGDKLAGVVAEPILGADAKLASLRELAARQGIAASETMAVGDGANDLPMIKAAGLGVAFRAKPKVAAEASARINHNDLTALLYIQGYRPEQFAR